VQNTYPVAATAKECTLVECTGDADCCDPADFFYSPSECSDLKASCDADPLSFDCDSFDYGCVCDQECNTTTSTCENKEEPCTSDSDCFGYTCDIASGKCVECTTDSECDTDETCSSNTCISGCKSDEECPLFNTCDGMTKKCKLTGCTSDRECILYRERADAVCKKTDTTSGVPECEVPCKENAECGASHVCDGGTCKFLGCETDAECGTYFKDIYGGALPGSVTAKCTALKK
jgi:hypothetical protein